MSLYDDFLKKVKCISNLQEIKGLLSWDQQVMMPEKGINARSEELSALEETIHKKLSDESLGKLIRKLENKQLSEDQQAVLREVKRSHDRMKKVSEDLQGRISRKRSEALNAWEKAKKKDDFDSFAPHLEELVSLKREYANQINPDEKPYKVLFKDFEPYIEFGEMSRILNELKSELPQFIQKIDERGREIGSSTFQGSFPLDKQRELLEEILEVVGFDFPRGRFDVSAHPFTFGNQHDSRITTRFDEGNILSAITSTLHEFGHALYDLNLEKEKYGTPLGQSREMSIHESQSRLWENHIVRSESFWKFLLPKLRDKFPDQFNGVTPGDCFESSNRIHKDNLIRLEADEVTYHLHIALRFELGRELINGNLEVGEIPQEWNEKMDEYLGVRPENDREGCLQDVHWAEGYFGYFPTYSLGSVISAQLYQSAESNIDDLGHSIENGNFKKISNWLKENIHRHGKKYKTQELIKRATGEKLSVDHFLDYVKDKYRGIYDLR